MAGVAKFFLGFTLAIAILFFAGVTTARYFVNRLTEPPPRPVFPNDAPPPTPTADTAPTPAAPPPAEASPTPAPEPTPVASPTPTPTSTPEATPDPENIERVVIPIGLILRQDATQASPQIGGIPYDGEVEVLGISPDGEWQRVRVLGSGQEGWIKSGNTVPAS